MGPPSANAKRAARQRNANKNAIASVLVEAGVVVRFTIECGATPLHFATGADAPEDALVPIVRELIKRGAVIDARTSAVKMALQLAVWRKQV